MSKAKRNPFNAKINAESLASATKYKENKERNYKIDEKEEDLDLLEDRFEG